MPKKNVAPEHPGRAATPRSRKIALLAALICLALAALCWVVVPRLRGPRPLPPRPGATGAAPLIVPGLRIAVADNVCREVTGELSSDRPAGRHGVLFNIDAPLCQVALLALGEAGAEALHALGGGP